ncbi:hypothetical protein N9J72_02295 [Candidatus Gracilibacteria bacterium]|nr:hypothetical protein [Candidatus Gracilibacteria bacterium]
MTKKRITAIRDFIDTAEKSLKNAKKLLKEIIEDENLDLNAELNLDTKGLSKYDSGESKIVEGVFTGEEMLGADGNKYPIPVNYSSKSKLVQGDKMKLTIEATGKMLYKQIQQIDRENKTGLLTQDKGKYQVVADGVAYDVLTAAVTHFKADIGDNVTVLIPAGKEATFGAIEAVMPKG